MGKSEIIENLRKIIELDPTYFAKVKTDKNLINIKEVNQLLDEIEQKARTRAKSAIVEAETSFSREPKIISNAEQVFQNLRDNSVLRSKPTYEESKTKYKYAETRLEFAKRKVASGEYIALLEAKQIAGESQDVVNESFRLVNSAIDIATNEEERAIKEDKRIKKENTKNIIKTIFLSPFLLIKAFFIGIIGFIIGWVIGSCIGLWFLHKPFESYQIVRDTADLFSTIGYILVALISLIGDIQDINKK